MTSEHRGHRLGGLPHLRWVALAAAAWLLVAPSDLSAQTVAFGQLLEDRVGFSELLATQLRERGIDARDPNWTIPLAATAGCPTTGIGTTRGCLAALARSGDVAVFVDGIVVGGARPQSLALVVWNTRTETMAEELLVTLTDGRIPRRELDRTLDAIERIARSAGPPPPQAAPALTAGPPPERGAVTATSPPRAPREDRGTADRIRIELRTRLVSRTLEQSFDDGQIAFDAPYYPGAEVAIEVFPGAFFRRDHAAAHIGLTLRTAKHAIGTTTEVVAQGERFEVDIPTRHDTSYYGLFYEWAVHPSLTLRPAVGWHAVEYALGYNPLYGNSFYQGVELGIDGIWHVGAGSNVRASAAVRPGLDLGSTISTYGNRGSAFGFGLAGAYRYRFPFGLYGDAEVRYDRYTSQITGGASDVDSVDGFQSFVISIGYAY